MKIAADSEAEFFEACGDREAIARELDAIIRAHAPHLEPKLVSGMSITMLGYGIRPYKYASGRSGEWPLIAIAPQKNYFSLYICAMTTEGEYYAESYRDQLGKVSCGRSCIRFKKPEDIDLKTVEKMITEVAKRDESGDILFGI